MRARGAAVLAALALVLVGCGGTETGNPGSASMAFGLRASEPEVVDVGPNASGTRVEALLIAIAGAELVPCSRDATAVVVIPDPTIVDLALGSGDYRVPPGEYCGLRLMLTIRDLPGGFDFPPVAAASVAAHGVRADAVPFTATSTEARTIAIEGTPFTIAPDEHVIFAFDVSRWLAALLDAAPVVDGRAIVDGGGALGARFDQQTSGGLFEDASGNGVIDPAEETPVISTPSNEGGAP